MAAWARCKDCARWFHLDQSSTTAECPSCGSGKVCVHDAPEPWEVHQSDRCDALFQSA